MRVTPVHKTWQTNIAISYVQDAERSHRYATGHFMVLWSRVKMLTAGHDDVWAAVSEASDKSTAIKWTLLSEN